MKITGVELTNIKGFQSLPKTELSPTINVFFGANNSGKSTILQSIYQLQGASVTPTVGSQHGETKLFFDEDGNKSLGIYNNMYVCILTNSSYQITDGFGRNHNFNHVPSSEPNNLIYPFFSNRKVGVYNTNITPDYTKSISGNFDNLFAKIERINDKHWDEDMHNTWLHHCNDILGFEMSTIGAENSGKRAVYHINRDQQIKLESMGDGIPNIIGLLLDLCIAENKIFLIEELENDIHPKVLKKLLNLIIAKSKTNQFFVSTHNNIVMRYLGSQAESKVFEVTSANNVDTTMPKLFVSSLKEIKTSEERTLALEDLGYDVGDYGLWSYWLILEESSAERLISEYFIKWFIPRLIGKIRTYSASGCDNVEKALTELYRTMTFIHLQKIYQNKVWVIIDSGDTEKKIIDNLQNEKFKSWNPDNFSQFDKHDFEEYYPHNFEAEVNLIKSLDKKDKRKAKKELLYKVLEWINNDEGCAKIAFEKSAVNVITKLKQIESVVSSTNLKF